MRYLKLYWMFFKQSALKMTAYQLNFWMLMVSNGAFFLVQLIFVKIIFSQVSSLAGWSKYDVFFYIGTFNIIDSLWCFGPFFNLISLSQLINDGTLDYYLIKPVNSQFMVSLRKVEISSLLSVVAGIAMIVYALVKMGTELTLGRILFYIFTMLNGFLIIYSLFLIFSCFSFWFIKTDFVFQIHGILSYFSLKPLDIYHGVIRFILSFVLPYGLMFTVVAKSAIKNISLLDYGIFLLICWGFFALSVLIWKYSLRRYSSASS